MDWWFQVADNPENHLYQIKRVEDFERAISENKIGAVLHFEGAGGIDPEFSELRLAHRLGLRTMGLSWSFVNRYATGALFRKPQLDRGLTDLGRKMVHETQRSGITVDVSHLNDPSFWGVIEETEKPIIASHSNARSVCPVPRNLTDDQIRAIHEKHGTNGINFSVGFLDPDRNKDMGLEVFKKHIDHIVEVADINTVAMGSDYDGTDVPSIMPDCSHFPKLFNYLLENGYSEQDLEKIAHGNLLRVFRETWKQ